MALLDINENKQKSKFLILLLELTPASLKRYVSGSTLKKNKKNICVIYLKIQLTLELKKFDKWANFNNAGVSGGVISEGTFN